MSTPKWTQGPWKFFNINGWVQVESATLRIARVVGESEEAEVMANARLIAAAPELYEELETICRLVELAVWTTNDLNHARRLLAKARGEATPS